MVGYWANYKSNQYLHIKLKEAHHVKRNNRIRKNEGKGYVLKETVSNDKKLYYVKVGLNINNELVPKELQKYENKWRSIEEEMEKRNFTS